MSIRSDLFAVPCTLLAFATVTAAQDRFPAREHQQPGVAMHVALATGDLDADGRDDLVATSGLPMLHVYRGKATHGIEPASLLAIDAPAIDVDLGDFDSDGRLDLAFTTTHKVFAAFGDGHGGFAAPVQIGFAGGGDAVAIADVDGDGYEDVVALAGAVSRLKTFFSNGAGGFLTGVVSTIGKSPSDFALADMNGDGVLDAVVASTGSVRVVTALGDGSGVFAKHHATGILPAPPATVALEDLDGDGDVDAAVGNATAGVLMTLAGSGDGKLGSPKVHFSGHGVAVGDWNHDGAVDIVGAYPLAGLYLHVNDGSGTFPLARHLPGPFTSCAVAFCDANGDGRSDVAFAAASDVPPGMGLGEESTTVGVVNGDGRGEVLGVLPVRTDPGEPSLGLAHAVDLDLDGLLDVAGSQGPETSSVLVRRADGGGGLGSTESYPLPTAATIGTGDVDGDGSPDIVAIGKSVSYVLLSEGSTLGPPIPVVAPGPSLWTTGDVDKDGDDDVVGLLQFDLIFWRSHGDGSFDAPVVSDLPIGFLASLELFEVVDLDGDATRDLVVQTYDGAIRSYRGHPTGEFEPWGLTPANPLWGAMAVADLDGDGLDELIAGTVSYYDPGAADSLIVYLADGQGAFIEAGSYTVGQNTKSIRIADIDGDGIPDAFVWLDHGHSAWLAGNGNGSFGESHRFASVGVPVGLGDLNGDGRTDLLVFPSTLPGPPSVDLQFKSVLQH